MNTIFDTVATRSINRNRIDMSNRHKTSFEMGRMIPIYVEETLPGDVIRCDLKYVLRTLALNAPVMNEADLYVNYFYCPNNVVWPEWNELMKGAVVGMPTIDAEGMSRGDLGHYMGMAPEGMTDSSQKVSALPLAMIAKIYDDYYAQAGIHTEKFTTVVSGNNPSYQAMARDLPPFSVWGRDYFTSCLTEPQDGSAILIPLIDENSLDVTAKAFTENTNPNRVKYASNDSNLAAQTLGTGADSILEELGNNLDVYIDPNGRWKVDLMAAAQNLQTLRKANATQVFKELQKRSGANERYKDFLLANYQEDAGDYRLSRPKHVGGFKYPINFSEVVSTAWSQDAGSDDVPLGELGGHGISVGGNNYYQFKAPDFGFMFCIVHVRPRASYFEGIDKQFQRDGQLDYYFSQFAAVGEQEVKLKELWALGTNAENESTFGYQRRYARYMFKHDQVSGQMTDELLYWHFARKFGTNKPALNPTFLDCDPPDRPFVEQTAGAHNLLAWFNNDVKMLRKVAKNVIPSLSW